MSIVTPDFQTVKQLFLKWKKTIQCLSVGIFNVKVLQHKCLL